MTWRQNETEQKSEIAQFNNNNNNSSSGVKEAHFNQRQMFWTQWDEAFYFSSFFLLKTCITQLYSNLRLFLSRLSRSSVKGRKQKNQRKCLKSNILGLAWTLTTDEYNWMHGKFLGHPAFYRSTHQHVLIKLMKDSSDMWCSYRAGLNT